MLPQLTRLVTKVSNSSHDGKAYQLKIVVTAELDNRDRQAVVNDLIPVFKRLAYNDVVPAYEVKDILGVHTVSVHEYGDKWTEVNFEVTVCLWSSAFLTLCDRFQRACNSCPGLPCSILELSEPEIFSPNCTPIHEAQPVATVSFGNFLYPDLFVEHFCRRAYDGHDERNAALMESMKQCSLPISADFEHDRSMLVLSVAECEKFIFFRYNQSVEPPEPAGILYEIKMRYESVNRIILNTLPDTNMRNNCIRLYFQLDYPPEIRKFTSEKEIKFPPEREKKYGRDTGARYRYFPEKTRSNKGVKEKLDVAINDSPVMAVEFTAAFDKTTTLYSILSRLHVRLKLPIEVVNVRTEHFRVTDYVPMPVRFIGGDYRRCALEENVGGGEYTAAIPDVDKYLETNIQKYNVFGLEYLIAALFTRGAAVRDQLLRSKKILYYFIEQVLCRFEDDKELTLESLERLLILVGEVKHVPSIVGAFLKIWYDLRSNRKWYMEILNRTKKDGYVRVRKAVVTPTKVMLTVPDVLMGNRVLRTHDVSGDGALRIQFRDDNGSQMYVGKCGKYILRVAIENTLLHGIHISDRHFVMLGSSNSQMRDNGCYFFDDGKENKARTIRASLGTFDTTNIPKYIARMGQCFTQAQIVDVELKCDRYAKTHDFKGGKDSNGDVYTYSDGVGKLSKAYAKQISQSLQLGGCIPSCFQIRFQGIKGVLSVDSSLDKHEEWAIANNVVGHRHDILFRPSQDKFEGSGATKIEIVKFSIPTPVCLNQPLIAILDQVGAMQEFQLHSRISDHVHTLLDQQLMQIAEMVMSEDKCRERLNELPKRIIVDKLSLARGFVLTQEPFFRSLLHACVKYTLKLQLMREQIKIPFNLGRSMFGVVDETGLLQYGQVFVQYTTNINLKTPGPNAARTVYKGRVMITKNPSTVAGDVRVFDAVDISELRHLVDVVVFPQSGPRPHPDEMAGSDLDGDEYSVIWDPNILITFNHEPLDYTKVANEPEEIRNGDVVAAMRKFYVKYIEQDGIGTIANAFKANCDLYGIDSAVCLNIAQKSSQALDFPKTGFSPDPLINEWGVDSNKQQLPPERAERFPDFMGKTHEPCYNSQRLAGQLFRRIQSVDNILTVAMATEGQRPVKLDETLIFEGYEVFRRVAEEDFSVYCAHLRGLMDSYGIADEAQLFSGCFLSLRNRYSDREGVDMSFYNTAYMIEQRATRIFKIFRENFFIQFGGYKACTAEPDWRFYGDCEESLSRCCKYATKDMMAKASAYYVICYEAAATSTNKRVLSFPWLVWDVLAEIRQARNSVLAPSISLIIDPLSTVISKFIEQYCSSQAQSMKLFYSELVGGPNALFSIKLYCRRYLGLDQLMFVLCKWAEAHSLLNNRLSRIHLCLLLIQFGVGHFINDNAASQDIVLDRTDDLEQSKQTVDLRCLIGGLGRFFVRFLQFLSSRIFETLPYIDFLEPGLGYSSKMLRGQWLDLHSTAVKSFYRIVLRSRFDELALDGSATSSDASEIVEMDPVVIEMAADVQLPLEILERKLKVNSDAEEVVLRRVFQDRIIVSARGTLENLRRLRELVSVEPMPHSQINGRDRVNHMNRLLYERIASLPL